MIAISDIEHECAMYIMAVWRGSAGSFMRAMYHRAILDRLNEREVLNDKLEDAIKLLLSELHKRIGLPLEHPDKENYFPPCKKYGKMLAKEIVALTVVPGGDANWH